jgi:ribonucleoside-diphosphate reductase alpha chain
MELGSEILSQITIFSKYAKYIPEVKRRETWEEIVSRYEVMLMQKFPNLKKEIMENAGYIVDKKVLPSMRALQFSGIAAEVNNARIYNCCYLPMDSVHCFSESMFLLLGGTGVGYSVQFQHVEKLPEIIKPVKQKRYLVQDSIIGWADAVKVLMKSYFGKGAKPIFDYRDVRPKGSRLITAGGKAPGPEPLKICLTHIEAILDRKQNGEKLTTLEVHDIMCHIANSVLSGGIRRAAMIALFSHDDEEMLTCKYGNWWELNEQRGRSNNSAVLERGQITEEQFKALWKKIELSNSGEPGFYWTKNAEWGTNPCCEIALRPYQFCNLCEVNVSDIKDEQDLFDRVRVAAFFGTLQASFTDFHYLRPIWQKTTEKDALLGIGMTGIGSGEILKYDLEKAAEIAKEVNAEYADLIGINRAARVTCIKPSGTTSCVLGTASGIHAWHNDYYLRTVRFNKSEDIAKYLMANHPEMCEDDVLRSHDTLCARIPIKAPEGSIMRSETPIELLERVKHFSVNWIKSGHRNGYNTHNVSATVSLKEDEWLPVGEWMWKNREHYNGLSVLPYWGGTYQQAPFEDITKEEYEERVSRLTSMDLTSIVEEDDTVNFGQIAACAGANCSVEQ